MDLTASKSALGAVVRVVERPVFALSNGNLVPSHVGPSYAVPATLRAQGINEGRRRASLYRQLRVLQRFDLKLDLHLRPIGPLLKHVHRGPRYIRSWKGVGARVRTHALGRARTHAPARAHAHTPTHPHIPPSIYSPTQVSDCTLRITRPSRTRTLGRCTTTCTITPRSRGGGLDVNCQSQPARTVARS